MEATSEDETVEIFTKAIKIINKNTIPRISFVTKYNEWSKRFEASLKNLTKTKENIWLTVSPNRYLQFSITSIIVLCFLESIRCKSTSCCLTGFAAISFLIIWTFLVALFGNLSKRDGAINSVIIYVGSLANLCQIMTNKLNRTRQLLKIIAGPNFLHTIPDCYKSQEKLQFSTLLRSWLRLCLSWMNVWGIIFGVQISVILYVFEFREYPQLFQSVSGLLIIVGIFTQVTKIKRCRLEMQQTRKILGSITLEYFQWFEKKCALKALIMKSEYFDLNWEDIFHHRFNIFHKDSIHSQLMYSLIAVGMAYGLRHETRETLLADAVCFLLFNKRPKLNSSSHQNIRTKEQKTPYDNLKKESKSCIYYFNILKNWLTSQKLTSSIPSEVPKSDKNASNKEIVKSNNHKMEFKELIEENVNETTLSQIGLEGKRQEKSECPKVGELDNNYCKVEDQALEIDKNQSFANNVHVTKDCLLPPEALKQDELNTYNINTENNEGVEPDSLSNATKLKEVIQKSTLEPTAKPVNIKRLSEESDGVEFAEQIHGNIEHLEQESYVFVEQIPPHINIEQLEQESEEFVDDTKIENQLIALNQTLESNSSLNSQETTNVHVLNTLSEDCEQEKLFNMDKLKDNISRDTLPSSSNDDNVLSLNELESLANSSNEIENTQEYCHFEWVQLNTTEIETDNFKMNDSMENSECCRIFNQYHMSEDFINYSENKSDIPSLNNAIEYEKSCQFIWNPSQNLSSSTEVDSKVNDKNDNITDNTNFSNNYSAENYDHSTYPTVFENLNDCGIIEDAKCNTPTYQNFISDDFRRMQVSEFENVSRNKRSPVSIPIYDKCNDVALSSDGIFSSFDSGFLVNCDSNSNKESTNNFGMEEIYTGSIEEVIDKLKSEEKTTSFPKYLIDNCSQTSQHSTEQNEINFLSAKDRRKYTRRENLKRYTKRTSRKGNQKYPEDRQQHTVHVLENKDDPEFQPTEKIASEVLEEKSRFEFFIENSIQNNDKINPFTDFENQRPTKNEYFTGCSSFSGGVLYTKQSNSFSEQPNHFFEQSNDFSEQPNHFSEQPNHFSEQPNHFSEHSNNFSEQSNLEERALDHQDSADDEESLSHSEPSPELKKTKFRWISDEDAILGPQNDDNIILEDLHDDSFVDEENAQSTVNATEPITYSLKCGNMNLEFTENSPSISLRFICESNEDVVAHKAPKRIVSKTFSDEEEFTYPEISQNNEESYDTDSSPEETSDVEFSETTMYSQITDSDQSSLIADDHVKDILLTGCSDIEEDHVEDFLSTGYKDIEEDHVKDIRLTGYSDIEEDPLTEHNDIKEFSLTGHSRIDKVPLPADDHVKGIPLTGHSRNDKVPLHADDHVKGIPLTGHSRNDKVPLPADDHVKGIPWTGHSRNDKVPLPADDHVRGIPLTRHSRNDKVPLPADDHVRGIPLTGHSRNDKVPLNGQSHIEEIPTAFGKTILVDSNVNQDLHFELDNVKLNFVPTPNSGTLEIDYKQSYGYNRLTFKSNDKKLKLKIKK